MKTYVIDVLDLQELIRGKRITLGDIWLEMDFEQLQKALTALDPLTLGGPEYTRLGVELLRDVGIDLDAKGGPDDTFPAG